jgi:hypothetical protein
VIITSPTFLPQLDAETPTLCALTNRLARPESSRTEPRHGAAAGSLDRRRRLDAKLAALSLGMVAEAVAWRDAVGADRRRLVLRVEGEQGRTTVLGAANSPSSRRPSLLAALTDRCLAEIRPLIEADARIRSAFVGQERALDRLLHFNVRHLLPSYRALGRKCRNPRFYPEWRQAVPTSVWGER